MIELLSNYGDIAVVWFDTPGNLGGKYSAALVDLVKKHQPDCLINSRIGNGFGDYASLGDMQIPLTQSPGAWESIDTTNDSWSYAWYDEHWKSAKTIAQNLISVVARGGSYMLNIGPKGDGSIPYNAVKNLTDAGAWIRRNEEAIYETTPSPFTAFEWGDCTVKENSIYIHIFKRPESGVLRLPSFKNNIRKSSLLCSGEPIKVDLFDNCIQIACPSAVETSSMIPIIKLELDEKPIASSTALFIDGEHSTNLEAIFADVENLEIEEVRWMEKFGEWKHSYNLWRWKEASDMTKWEINVLKPGRYNIKIDYACDLDSENSEWEISSSNDSITFVGLDTGMTARSKENTHPRARYLTVELGVLTLNSTGIQTISVNPIKQPFNDGILIRRIIIEPYE